MLYSEYKKQMKKAVAKGESEKAVIERHIKAMYIPIEITKHAQRYKKEEMQ